MKILSQQHIKVTPEDYKKLKLFEFNRDCSVREDLKERMSKYGFIGTAIIIATKIYTGEYQWYIADGQNRLKTAASMEIDADAMLYTVDAKSQEELVNFVGDLNTGQKAWHIADYVKAYATLGKVDYTVLDDFTRENGHTHLTNAIILSGVTSSGPARTRIKSGTFKATHVNRLKATMKFANELLKALKGTVRISDRMFTALAYTIHQDYFKKDNFVRNFVRWVNYLKVYKIDNFKNTFEKFNEEDFVP